MQSDAEAREARAGSTAPGPDPPAPEDPAGPTPTLDEAQLDQLLIYAREISTLHQQGREQLQVLRQLHTQLQIKEVQRTRLMSYLMTIQAEERNRIAAALHRGPLSSLQHILLTTERAKRRLADGATEETRNDLGRLRLDVQKIVADLRLLINELRPAVLDTVGLLGALDFLAEQVSRESGLTVTVSSRLGARLNPTLETVIFRMVQEALTNVREHAAAQNAWIHLARQGDEVHLDIRDDGKGFTTENWRMRALAAGHIGLAGLHERAELVGGQVAIESSPELGTTLHCVLPFVPATPGPALAADPAPGARPAG